MFEPGVVIDNSVVMAWCFEDESNRYTDDILDSLKYMKAVVPSIWPLEVGNVLVVAERRGRLTRSDSTRFLEMLSELPITVEEIKPEKLMREVYILAGDNNLSTYDASYLHLAMRKGLPLATSDKALRKAAADLNVVLFESRQKE